MNYFTPGPSGCVKVVIRLKSAFDPSKKDALQKKLEGFVQKSPYGKGGISDLVSANAIISFTVNGQCNFYLMDLEKIVIALGGDVESSEGDY